MELLRFSQGKLLAYAALCAAIGAFLLYSFVEPTFSTGVDELPRRSVSGLGYDLFTPLLAGFCLIVAARMAILAWGDQIAVAATKRHLLVTSLWGTRRIAWNGLAHMSVEQIQVRWVSVYYLNFHIEGGLFGTRKIRLPLQWTDIGHVRANALIEKIKQISDRPGDLPAGNGNAASVAEPSSDADFDPDAAFARYMARKAAGGVDQPRPTFDGLAGDFDPEAALARYMARQGSGAGSQAPAAQASVPVTARPGFGRKRL